MARIASHNRRHNDHARQSAKLRRALLSFMWVCVLVFAAALPLHTNATTPTDVPSLYGDLYSQLNADVSDFQASINTAVNSGGNGARAPVLFAGQLTNANCNIGPSLLNASSMTLINEQLQALKAIGASAVSVEVSFPMLYSNFLGSSYSQWVTFYGNVAAAVRAQGLKLIVESQSMIPSGLESNAWGAQLQAFYPTLTYAQYAAARAATAAVVASTMRPDYFVVQEEPDTESNQAGQPNLGTIAGSTAMLNGTLTAVSGLVPTMKVGAGFGTWLSAYQSFANAFTRTGCSSTQPCITSKLDFLDMHVFPVIEHAIDCAPEVACAQGSTNFWQNTMSVVATAKAAGLPMTVSQTWLRKVRDSEWNILSGGGDIEEAREAYGFWAPLDQAMLKAVHDLANYEGMYWIAPFNTQNFSAYLTWSNSTAISTDCGAGTNPCGSLTPAQVFAQVQSAANTATAQGQQSSTGQYWKTISTSETSDCLFNWAESHYPTLFSPPTTSQVLAPYYYRYYSGTHNYVGSSSADGNVYYLDSGGLVNVGALAVWLGTSACND